MIETSPTPLRMYWDYLLCVSEALHQQPEQWTFKSDPRYRAVLEHTPRDFAESMLTWSLAQMPSLTCDRIRGLATLNDSVGTPAQESIGQLGMFAPSNMRYLCHAIKLWQHVDSLGLPEVNIVEIGGGYGGLALWVRGLAHLFKTRLHAYWIVDLPEVTILQFMVAQALNVPLFALTPDAPYFEEFHQGMDALFCFSAYAFSEFDQPTRDWYAEHLLPKCRHGLMVWNFPEGPIKGEDGRMFGGPAYQFVEWPITRVPDEPALYVGHEVVTW